MATLINIQREGVCKACSAVLPVGTRVRYYGRFGMYGLECHPDTRKADGAKTAPKA